MKKNKNPLSIFITDNGVALFGGSLNDENKEALYGQDRLAVKVIENGYIKEPEMLLDHLRHMWKKYKIKPKFVRFVVQDQNILVREFEVKKSELKKKSIEEYFHEQINKKFHVPFKDTIISHQIRTETEDSYSVLLYIADENLLQDYYDVFEKLGVKYIVFDLAVSALMEISDTDHSLKDKNIMIVSFYDYQLSIQIIEKNQLVFGIIEEYEGKREDYFSQFEIYCERVANYYEYNMRKGNQKINKTLLFNLNDIFDSKDITKFMIPKLKDLKPSLFNVTNHESFFNSKPKGILVAYASNEILLNRDKFEKIVNFKLNRMNRLKYTGYYIFVLALAIFTSLSVIYLPYFESRQAITDQQYINESLLRTKDILERNINNENILELPSAYTNSYELIVDNQDLLPLNEIEDLEDALTGNLAITYYIISAQEKSMTITLMGDSTHECLDYVLLIYELYGLDETEEDTWMTSEPSTDIISDGLVEVTITYA
ncbi:pilus assembly protein PilM [Mycoplasmatota bacterium]|nr:pilus assembly protein PilM [Mycoplasmatota bacterium]